MKRLWSSLLVSSFFMGSQTGIATVNEPAAEYSKFLMRAVVLGVHSEIKSVASGSYPGATATLFLLSPALIAASETAGTTHQVDAQNFLTFAISTGPTTFGNWVSSTYGLPAAALTNAALFAGYRVLGYDTGESSFHSQVFTTATLSTITMFLKMGKQAAQALGLPPSLASFAFIALGAHQKSALPVSASHLRRNVANTLVQASVISLLTDASQNTASLKNPWLFGIGTVGLGTALFFIPRNGYPLTRHIGDNARQAAFMVGFVSLAQAVSSLF